MLRFLLCDDDAETLVQLKTHLHARYGDKVTVNAYTSPHDALEQPDNSCDAAILDIIMPELTGVKLAKALREQGFAGHIIFLTTSRGYAPESYEVNALDYLIKPIDAERLDKVLDKLEARLQMSDSASIVLSMGRETRRVPHRDIYYAEAGDHVVYFGLTDSLLNLPRTNFSDTAPLLLSDPRFAQCHGSFIVNMDKIRALDADNAVLQSGKCIPIAKRYAGFRKQYMKWLMGVGREG